MAKNITAQHGKRPVRFALLLIIVFTSQFVYAQPSLTVEFEIVTDSAVTGDGGNAWGGHQCRIVRTDDGVFTAYTVEGGGYLEREWHVVQRTTSGWTMIAQGVAGREPVNLLAGPEGTLYVIGWPEGNARMWTLKREGEVWNVNHGAIGGQLKGYWPYNSAGISRTGNVCVISSEGGSEPDGSFYLSYFNTAQQLWTNKKFYLPFRYCYTYVFPLSDGSVSLVSTRDVKWEALGYTKPDGAGDYVFNAFRYWHTEAPDAPLESMVFVEEPPTAEFPLVICNAQKDAYIDTKENVHVVYAKYGLSTGGVYQNRHALYNKQGENIYDGPLPVKAGGYSRIFQDVNERLFLLGDTGRIYLLAEDGYTITDSVDFDLQGYQVEYSGFGISAPRTGTPLNTVLDVVFPTNGGKDWIYFSIQIDDLFPWTGIDPGGEIKVKQFRISQNYPNPFNPETMITFYVPNTSFVNVEIFNILGQHIRTLVDEQKHAGSYDVVWDGRNDFGQIVSNGIYLYRMSGGGFTRTMKCVFMK